MVALQVVPEEDREHDERDRPQSEPDDRREDLIAWCGRVFLVGVHGPKPTR
jgi:hypothetical protein